jgi:hypothetical protein
LETPYCRPCEPLGFIPIRSTSPIRAQAAAGAERVHLSTGFRSAIESPSAGRIWWQFWWQYVGALAGIPGHAHSKQVPEIVGAVHVLLTLADRFPSWTSPVRPGRPLFGSLTSPGDAMLGGASPHSGIVLDALAVLDAPRRKARLRMNVVHDVLVEVPGRQRQRAEQAEMLIVRGGEPGTPRGRRPGRIAANRFAC